MKSLPDPLFYIMLAVSAFVENVFPPIPGDTITAFGAFLVGTGRLDLSWVFLATTIGSLCGFMCLFWIGQLLGRRFFIERDLWLFKAEDIIRAENWFRRYGYFLVLFNRFFPGVRSVISIAGGISGLNTLKVTILALVSSAIWNIVWISLGFAVGTKWALVRDRIEYLLGRYQMATIIFFCLLLLLFLLWKLLRKKSQG